MQPADNDLSRSDLPKTGKKIKQCTISRILFHPQSTYLVQGTTQQGAKVTMTEGQGQKSRSNYKKKEVVKKYLNYWPYLKCYFTHILHTCYQATTQYGAFND